ncbi:MAG: 4-alpha-glucanotransferase [Chlamydiota bacterium]
MIPTTCLTYPIWNQIGIHPHHGINIPLFALRSQKNSDFGTFLELRPLIDFCQSVGMDTIQLLPLNDSGSDVSPYNIISSCALDPVYIDTNVLPSFPNMNHLGSLPYAERKKLKLKYLYDYYLQTGSTTQQEIGYKKFIENNPRVSSYALFRSLKDLHEGKPFWEWEKQYQNPSEHEKKAYINTFPERVNFYLFLQYLCFSQLSSIKAYATTKKVFLFGDLPILISPDSADVWTNPSLFNRNFVVGAPPDNYNKEGQKWGFFPDQYEVLQKTQFAWWKERLTYISHFYDMYRIDHVVGLFRLWIMTPEAKAIDGFYLPKDPALWLLQGKETLENMIQASSMLPIAEDLGVIPNGLREILQSLGVCTTKFMRWERNWEGDKKFVSPNNYPPISLTTVSTHDSETLALWWRDFPKEAKLYANEKKWDYKPLLSIEQQEKILYESHHSGSLFHVNLLQEYLRLFPELSYPTLEEDRINIPGKVLSSNWTYRFKPTVEEIVSHEGLKKLFRKVIS